MDKYKRSGVTYLALNVYCAPVDKVYFVADPHIYLKPFEMYGITSRKACHLIVYHVLIYDGISCRTIGKK